MRTSLVVAVSAALVALCALALPVRAKAALDAKGAAEQCVCQLSDPRRPLQLVRGADQVSRCEKGEYCNCAAKTVAICDFSFMDETFRFNEEEQMCDFRVDCQAFFDRTTVSPATAEPTPPTLPPLPTEPEVTTAAAPTSPPEPCRCSDASRALQLIRGADQESRCQKGDYCDCRAKTVQRCDDFEALGERMRFNEQDQECDLTFDCQAFFRGPTERPSTATPRTAAPTAPPATAPTSPPQQCTCADPGDASRALQLVRGALGGASELALCQRGDYCHCASRTLQHCDFTFLGETAKFDEEQQMCDFDFDCEAFLRATPGPAAPTPRTSTTGTSGTSRGWVPSSGSTRVALSATLFSLTAVLTVVNLLLLYRRTCWPRLWVPYPSRPAGAPAVPTVYSPEFENCTRKVPLQSVA